MSKKTPEPVVHKDIFGRELNVGSAVAYPQSNTLHVGYVTKLNNKMIRLVPVNSNYRTGHLKYSHECVLVDGPQVTMYILRNSK